MFFVVRNDASHSDVLYVTSDETWQAYNDYAGHSLYGGAGTFDLNNRAYKVSYNRPFDTRRFEAATFLFNGEYPMIRWLEANGFDVSYFTDVDTVRNGSLLTNHKTLLSVGHDEYESQQRRANLTAARDAGVNLAFFSGNEGFWKTRWENSIDGTNTPYRTLVCYKETYYGTNSGTYQPDPLDPPTWTGTWRDPRFSPPADAGRPENALTGTIFMVNGPGPDNSDLSILVPAADGKMRFWRNTSIATQSPGQVATLPPGTLGYEWDGDLDNGSRPAGLIPLSTSPYTLTQDLLLDYGATYGAGTITHHVNLYRAPSGALVFGAGTVQWAWGLDSNHDNGSAQVDIRMQQATVNLLADMGVQPTTLQPGLITAVKSTDSTPPAVAISSPAAGSTVPYGTTTTVAGTASDSGGGVVGAVEVSVDGGQTWHPATGREQWSYNWQPGAFSGSATVMARAVDDSGNLQTTPAASNFSVAGFPTCPCSIWPPSATPGTVSAADNASVEVGLRFRSDAAGLVTGVRFYKGASNTGVHIGNLWTAQGAKLASVTFTNETPSGWQQASFASAVAISANTTYVISYYAPSGGYADDSSYFAGKGVDRAPLHALANGADGGNGVYVYASGGGFPFGNGNASNYWVDLTFTASSTFTISGTVSGGGGAIVALGGTANATLTADASGNYSFNGVVSGSYSVTPSNTGFIFNPASQNVTVAGASVTGVNFTATSVPTYSVSGTVAGGGGTTLSLSGTANQVVTADPSGNYTFSNLVGGNYSVTPSKTGYTFSPASQSITVSNSNLTGINFSATALPTWSISGTVTGTTGVTVVLSGAASATTTTDASGNYIFGGLLNGAYLVTPNQKGFVFAPLNRSVTVNGANIAGVAFTGTQARSIWNDSTLPGTASENDPSAVELGLKFRADSVGFVTGIRFYKGSNNSGTHIGNLWTNTGTNLATVTFTGESGSGWQQANFSAPVSISPGTTYVVSYYAPNGGYAADVNFFASTGVDTPPLHALANGADGPDGLYRYGSGGGFPTSTFNSTNYWVDLVFTTSPTFSIAGTLSGGAGSTVTLTGTAGASVTADSSGNYTFSNLANGSYTVTPSKAGLSFTPASQPATVNGANVTGVNFTATVVPTFSIAGTLSGGAGSTVTLTGTAGATVTADSSGNYTFSTLANGSYTVTPSKTGLSFTPFSQPVTVNGSNVTGVNFTSKPGLAIDAKLFKDQSAASSTVVTPAFSTVSGSELLLAFIAADAVSSGNSSVSGVTGAGLTWVLVKRTNSQRGTSEIWRTFAPSPLTNVTVTATLSQKVQSSLTVLSFTGADPSGTNGSGAIGPTAGGSAASGAPTASLVTTRNNSWVFGVGNDYDNAIARTPGTAQSLVHQYLASSTGDTYWVQMQTAPTPVSATTVILNDTAPSSDRYNLSICAVLPAP